MFTEENSTYLLNSISASGVTVVGSRFLSATLSGLFPLNLIIYFYNCFAAEGDFLGNKELC